MFINSSAGSEEREQAEGADVLLDAYFVVAAE
jgi:hypothetical protein